MVDSTVSQGSGYYTDKVQYPRFLFYYFNWMNLLRLEIPLNSENTLDEIRKKGPKMNIC